MSTHHCAPEPQKKVVEASVISPLDEDAFRGEVERLAHHYWLERGCPVGTPDEDWFRAEHDIKAKLQDASAE